MPPKSKPETTWRQSWLLKCALLLLVVALFLGGIIWAGWWGRDYVQGSDRYVIPFADIECNPPVGMDRTKFLDEVLYYASPKLPERVNLIDEELPDKLHAGFGKHPWVATVEGVSIHPPKKVLVKLTHRTAVLAVKVGPDVLAVDATGVLLPKNAPTLGLPFYEGDAPAPKGIGQRWGDPNVEAAARKARRDR
jgi:hypothetical protein